MASSGPKHLDHTPTSKHAAAALRLYAKRVEDGSIKVAEMTLKRNPLGSNKSTLSFELENDEWADNHDLAKEIIGETYSFFKNRQGSDDTNTILLLSEGAFGALQNYLISDPRYFDGLSDGLKGETLRYLHTSYGKVPIYRTQISGNNYLIGHRF